MHWLSLPLLTGLEMGRTPSGSRTTPTPGYKRAGLPVGWQLGDFSGWSWLTVRVFPAIRSSSNYSRRCGTLQAVSAVRYGQADLGDQRLSFDNRTKMTDLKINGLKIRNIFYTFIVQLIIIIVTIIIIIFFSNVILNTSSRKNTSTALN